MIMLEESMRELPSAVTQQTAASVTEQGSSTGGGGEGVVPVVFLCALKIAKSSFQRSSTWLLKRSCSGFVTETRY